MISIIEFNIDGINPERLFERNESLNRLFHQKSIRVRPNNVWPISQYWHCSLCNVYCTMEFNIYGEDSVNLFGDIGIFLNSAMSHKKMIWIFMILE